MASGGIFPETRVSALERARSDDAAERTQAWRDIAAVYHRPVYLHLRLKWRQGVEGAADLTQDFFLHAIERDVLGRYDARRGRFRSYLRSCIDHLVLNRNEAHARLKRGGGTQLVELDLPALERLAALSTAADAERVFEVEWARSVMAQSVERLRRQLLESGRAHQFHAFMRHDLSDEPVSYQQLAAEMGVKLTDVTNYLAAARRRFRLTTLETLRELTATRDEFEAEALALCGPLAEAAARDA